MIEQFDPFWYEEPVSARNLGALAECRREIPMPVVTGEELYTRRVPRGVRAPRRGHHQPRRLQLGGILELKEIAAMAEPYHVVVSPHNYNSTTVGLAATLHVSAASPNFLITEYFVNFEPRARGGGRESVPRRGRVSDRPDGAGLGIELREDVLARYAYREFPPRMIPTPRDEGP